MTSLGNFRNSRSALRSNKTVYVPLSVKMSP